MIVANFYAMSNIFIFHKNEFVVVKSRITTEQKTIAKKGKVFFVAVKKIYKTQTNKIINSNIIYESMHT